MNYFVKLGLVLLIITALASGILAFVNDLTKDQIADNKIKAQEIARKQLMPQAETFTQKSITLPAKEQEKDPLKKQTEAGPLQFNYYECYNAVQELVGYSFMASRYGYSSHVKTMVAVGLDLNIIKIDVIDQAETPGLGANADATSFEDRFMGKNQNQLKVTKDGGEIEALTGATITSRAVTNSIAQGLEILKNALNGEAE